MNEKRLQEAEKPTEEDVVNLLRKKPDATIADLVHGIPSSELSVLEIKSLKAERDQLILHNIELQHALDFMKKCSSRAIPSTTIQDQYDKDILDLETKLISIRNKIVEIETELGKDLSTTTPNTST